MRNLYILTVFTVILGSWNLCASAQNVDFPDANLAAAVRISLGLAKDADIPLTSLQELTQLHADNFEITNLIGLEKATSAIVKFMLIVNVKWYTECHLINSGEFPCFEMPEPRV